MNGRSKVTTIGIGIDLLSVIGALNVILDGQELKEVLLGFGD
jgi:hypothetical protein